MRENRPYGSEGGAARKGRLYPYPRKCIDFTSALPGKCIDFTEEDCGCFRELCWRHMSLPRHCHVLGVPCLSESGHLLGFAARKRPHTAATGA
jgi:hypothetical protein